MRQIYIAADGGGTKLELGAVSADGELLCSVRVGKGINRTTTDERSAADTVREAFRLLSERTGGAKVIGCAGYFMHNTDIFGSVLGCKAVETDEGTLGLYAAGIYGDGVLMLSGTGADAYIIKNEKVLDIIGGYGAFLGDPGSGFAIGKDALNAAIADHEGRGEKTLLTRLLREKYPSDTFRGSLYGIYREGQVSRNIASFCMECERAADEGDAVARNIFRKAALDLAGHAVTGYTKYGLDKKTPYSFAGGVIKHDIERKEHLMLPYITDLLEAEGITERRLPVTTPLCGAAEWIKRHLSVFDA